ncbi:metallophosphoesterase family protein [Singulisphaera sp. PoT]|uniref:metallophosphoesterase family protein n=1 Tax=Singulisphaera sp. PoT TaxID=3411797 RepID=UPI003BF55FB2
MKLLLFSDLHTDEAAAQKLVEQSSQVDVLVGAGDFASVRRRISACIDILKAVDKPTVLVAGNNETTEELIDACKGWSQAHVLHGEGVTIAGRAFFGIGGGIPVTPFGSWSYDFSEYQASLLLKDCPPGCVLVSHSPPKGAVDVSSSGQSLGSEAVREVIERVGPALVVCGHIHASAGKEGVVGSTPVINAGPVGIVWETGP